MALELDDIERDGLRASARVLLMVAKALAEARSRSELEAAIEVLQGQVKVLQEWQSVGSDRT